MRSQANKNIRTNIKSNFPQLANKTTLTYNLFLTGFLPVEQNSASVLNPFKDVKLNREHVQGRGAVNRMTAS